MASDDKKTKTASAPKTGSAGPKEAPAASAIDAPAKAKAVLDGGPSKDEGEKTSAAPSGYSRGEGQKPVTQAYKDNWNAIYGKKKKKKR